MFVSNMLFIDTEAFLDVSRFNVHQPVYLTYLLKYL